MQDSYNEKILDAVDALLEGGASMKEIQKALENALKDVKEGNLG